MRKLASLIAGLMAIAVAAMVMPGTASAAPPGAATRLSFDSQTCFADGTASGILTWQSSNLGPQYVDLGLSANFSNYSRGGPYSSSIEAVNLVQLKVGTTYYVRVLTAVGGGTINSDTVAVTPDCSSGGGGTGAMTKPTNLSAQVRSDGSVRFDWTPGVNNTWYCVDTALSLQDLYNVRNSWRNHGCWTTNSELTVSGLSCGSVYYWLVYSWNGVTNVKSDATLVQTRSCASTISPPTNLQATRLNDGGVLFDWKPGNGNIWFCLDTALSEDDLLDVDGSWRNHGCWNTNSELVVYNLDCSQTYYWLVYAWNTVANTKSAVASTQTQACKSELELAPIQDVDVVKTGSNNYRADIIAVLPNGCHEPDSHRVQRYGDTIEITVWNEVAPGPCTFIYREYELNINLGSDFDEGETYKVIVNDDESDTFVAD